MCEHAPSVTIPTPSARDALTIRCMRLTPFSTPRVDVLSVDGASDVPVREACVIRWERLRPGDGRRSVPVQGCVSGNF
jgi:hypothetical protein